MVERRLPLLLLLASSACAQGPVPVKEPPLPAPDSMELFHRSRFSELSRDEPERIELMARDADAVARAAYRDGEGKLASDLISRLDDTNKTRKILEALLEHAKLDQPLRASNHTRGTIDLPLASVALDRGYPIVDVDLGMRRLRLLWDTGATENLLSPTIAETLGLDRTDVQFATKVDNGGLVVRFAATAVDQIEIGPWKIANVPFLVTELDSAENLKRDMHGIDGFLSPQLLIPRGCFSIDRTEAILTIGFDAESCGEMMGRVSRKTPLYALDGELYTDARVHNRPGLAVQVETGSAVSFLRVHASRYLPGGMLFDDPSRYQDEIAHGMRETVRIEVAGRAKAVSAIDLAPARGARAHDDIATLGNDVMLQGRGIVVSLASKEMGVLPVEAGSWYAFKHDVGPAKQASAPRSSRHARLRVPQ